MTKAKKPPTTSPPVRRDYRTKPVQFGFVDPEKVPQDERPEMELPPAPTLPPVTEADELRNQIASDMLHAEYLRNGWLIEGRAPRESTQDIDAALREAFPDGNYPKGYAAKRAKLQPIYEREGWGEVPDRFVMDRAIKRLKRAAGLIGADKLTARIPD